MTKIVVRDGNVDVAIKKFKVGVARSGVPSEIRKHKFHVKPGVKKREEQKEMIKNSRKRKRRD